MKIKKFFITPIKGYQYLSKMLPASCRYYPTCSEYAAWQFEFNRPDKALLQSTLRILRCNQLFAGGIDYPIVSYSPPLLLTLSKESIKVKYWLIPTKRDLFYVIKDYEFFS